MSLAEREAVIINKINSKKREDALDELVMVGRSMQNSVRSSKSKRV
jgi:hypothetical protein